MKRLLACVSGILFVCALLWGCAGRGYRIGDIVDLPDEQPSYIVIRFDDPSVGPRTIDAKEDVASIMSKLTGMTYKKVGTGSPAPLGNTAFELHYADGVTLELGAVYVSGGNGEKYMAGSTELGSLLESYRP